MKKYEDYIFSKHKDIWEDWSHYDNCKSFRNSMTRLNMYDAYKDWCESRVDFLSKDLC